MTFRSAVLWLLSVLLWLSAAGDLQAQKVRETVLPNGLRVLTKEVHAAPVVATFLWYRVGSRNENVGMTGISHQIEHLMFKGTRRLKTGDIDRLITRAGGENNAFTNYDFTAYYIELPKEELNVALRIEADRMTGSRMSPEDLAKEKTVVLSELEGDENNPQFVLDEYVQGAAFHAHPYHWPVIGFKSDVQSFTPEKVRSYYRTYYQPNNATLAIAGDFSTDEVLGRVRALFGRIPRAPDPPEVLTEEPPQRGERRVVVKKEGLTHYLEAEYHVPPFREKDSNALDVLDAVLTGGKSSRLYKALVESGLAASVDSYLPKSHDPGWYGLYMTVRSGVDPDTVEKVLFSEIGKVQRDTLDDRELQKAVNQTKAQFIYAKDNVSSQAYYLGYFETVASYKLLDTYVDGLKAVTKADIRRVANQYLIPDNRTVGIFEPIPPKPGQALPPSQPAIGPRHYKPPQGIMDFGIPESQIKNSKSKIPSPARTERIALPNGLVLVVRENHANPTVGISGNLKAGGMYNPKDRMGLASFTAEMLARGTTTQTSQQIAEELDFIGARLSTSAGIEAANFQAYCLSENFEQVFTLLADLLRHPSFPEGEVAKLRGEFETGIKEENDDLWNVSRRELSNALFPEGHPYHQTPRGTLESVGAITRQDVLGFYQTHYRPETMILIVVGDVTAEQVKTQCQALFGDWSVAGKAPVYGIPSVPLAEKPERKIVPMMDKSEAIVRMGHTGISRSDLDYYPCEVMNFILGSGSFTSRLMADLRDKQGLTYGVFSYFQATQGAGPFGIVMQVNPKDVDRAVSATRADLEEFIAKGITEQELKEAKDYLIGNLPLSLESNSGIAQMLLETEFYHLGLDYVERYPALVRAVTREDVQIMARKHLHPDRLTTVIAGPYKP
jgi:zinc protease